MNARASTADKEIKENENSKDLHIKIVIGNFKVKMSKELTYRSTIGIYSKHEETKKNLRQKTIMN